MEAEEWFSTKWTNTKVEYQNKPCYLEYVHTVLLENHVSGGLLVLDFKDLLKYVSNEIEVCGQKSDKQMEI